MLIKNGLIYDAVNKTPYCADIRTEGTLIKEIAANLSPADGEEVIDAAGLRVYPGFIDAHSHLGLDNYGMGYEGHDYNEMNDIVACHLRALDSFNPQERGVRFALEGGVTTVGTGPGSANVLGGTFIAVKTHGHCVDDMIIKDSVAMKCAFGENPKRCYQSKGDSARMTTAAKLREMLFNAQDYLKRKEAAEDESKLPKFDIPEGFTQDGYLTKLAWEGFAERFAGTEHENDQTYISQLEFELETIKKTGYAGYFLIVWDYIRWAKEQGIAVGPGRGSGAGSLVLYCLHITEALDPLKFGLLFERERDCVH
jgi:hypothetical protein